MTSPRPVSLVLIAASVAANLMIAAALLGIFAPDTFPLLARPDVIWPLLAFGVVIEAGVMMGFLRAFRRLGRLPPVR